MGSVHAITVCILTGDSAAKRIGRNRFQKGKKNSIPSEITLLELKTER